MDEFATLFDRYTRCKPRYRRAETVLQRLRMRAFDYEGPRWVKAKHVMSTCQRVLAPLDRLRELATVRD